MKIKSIKLCNIGPYIGNNCLEFNINNKIKNIILIGGKNGAGKTSLFNAVKICIYGCKAFGHESINQYYLDDVAKLINYQERLAKSGTAEIIADILLDDGKKNSLYSLKRQWQIEGKKIREIFSVTKDEKNIDEKEKVDFEKYIFQLIPPDLFKFYFFDGEKISDFAFDGTNNSDFKNAFLKLCGLDTLDLILTNFKRIYRGSSNISSYAIEYEKIQEEKKIVNKQIEEKNLEKSQNIHDIIEIDEELAVSENLYFNAGGIDVKAWKNMHEELRKQEILRSDKRKWLREIANNVIPFVILSSQLEELKLQIELESKIQSEQIIKQEIRDPKLAERLSAIFEKVHFEHPTDLTEKVLDEIINAISNDNAEDYMECLSLSQKEQLEIFTKINSLLAFDINRIEEATKEIDKSLGRTEKIREKIKKSSIIDYEKFLNSKNLLLEKKSILINKNMIAEKELFELIAKDLHVDAEFKRIKIKYEEELKDKSIKNISARAILAFEELQNRLYKKFISKIEQDFKCTFSTLINKQDLLDGIFVDEFLKVIPYKNIVFQRTEIISLKQKFGEEYLFNLLGIRAFEILQQKLNGNDLKFTLPVEVKQQLSAGEKQIFIMSLYKALASLNKINVPYIIDTPFARIDGEHRKKILEEFFLKLTGQVIILSTDEEIVDDYKEIIDNRIANTFILKHEKDSNTQIISNTYFGELI